MAQIASEDDSQLALAPSADLPLSLPSRYDALRARRAKGIQHDRIR